MKKVILSILSIIFLSFVNIPTVHAQGLDINSTQARVQKDINHDWTQHLEISCKESFRVGSFYNGSGQLTPNDQTKIVNVSPSGNRYTHKNGDYIKAVYNGEYRVEVDTWSRDGKHYYEIATVKVSGCGSNNNGGLEINSTQARVQIDTSHPWTQHLDRKCHEPFRVGSFYNGSGQFTPDSQTKIVNVSPSGNHYTHKNGDYINPRYNGTYRIEVDTWSRDGKHYYEIATVNVDCNGNNDTKSIQTKFRKNTNESWQSSLTLGCGEQFYVATVKNDSNELVNNHNMKINGPKLWDAFKIYRDSVGNNERIRAFWPGDYEVSTNVNVNGTNYSDTSIFHVNCSYDLFDVWKNLTK